MKKGLLILSALVSIVCIFTACKNSDDTDGTPLSATVVQLNESFMDVPDGLVINSEDDLNKLSQNYENIANCVEGQNRENYYTQLAECIEQNLTENFFENHSYLLVNFYHSSSEINIGYSSAYMQNGLLNLVFDIESPECLNMDIIAKPFLLSIDKIENVEKFEIKVNNLLLNNHSGGFNSATRNLKHY